MMFSSIFLDYKMGSELSVSAEEQTVETEREEPSERQEESKHSVLFLTEEEAREPSKVTAFTPPSQGLTIFCAGYLTGV